MATKTNARKTLEAAYAAMQANSGIEVGDTVRVLRVAADKEYGWGNVWDNDMDKTVGRTMKVKSLDATGGVELDNGFGYPVHVLALVKKAKPAFKPVTVKLNKDYAAVIGEKQVQVGCQSFTHATILALAEQVKIVQALVGK